MFHIYRQLLKTKKTQFLHLQTWFFLIVYELGTQSQDLSPCFTLKDCLIGGIKLAEKADPDKHLYSGYGIGFDSCSEYLLTDGSVGKNVIILELIWTRLCLLIKRKKILGKCATQGLDDTTLTAEAKYLIDFSRSNKKFC